MRKTLYEKHENEIQQTKMQLNSNDETKIRIRVCNFIHELYYHVWSK